MEEKLDVFKPLCDYLSSKDRIGQDLVVENVAKKFKKFFSRKEHNWLGYELKKEYKDIIFDSLASIDKNIQSQAVNIFKQLIELRLMSGYDCPEDKVKNLYPENVFLLKEELDINGLLEDYQYISEDLIFNLSEEIYWDSFDFEKYIGLLSERIINKILDRIPRTKMGFLIKQNSLEGAINKYPMMKNIIVNEYFHLLLSPTEEDMQRLIKYSNEGVELEFWYILQNGRLTIDTIKYFLGKLTIDDFNPSAYTKKEFMQIQEIFKTYQDII
jgi:hypothetical protein